MGYSKGLSEGLAVVVLLVEPAARLCPPAADDRFSVRSGKGSTSILP